MNGQLFSYRLGPWRTLRVGRPSSYLINFVSSSLVSCTVREYSPAIISCPTGCRRCAIDSTVWTVSMETSQPKVLEEGRASSAGSHDGWASNTTGAETLKTCKHYVVQRTRHRLYVCTGGIIAHPRKRWPSAFLSISNPYFIASYCLQCKYLPCAQAYLFVCLFFFFFFHLLLACSAASCQ